MGLLRSLVAGRSPDPEEPCSRPGPQGSVTARKAYNGTGGPGSNLLKASNPGYLQRSQRHGNRTNRNQRVVVPRPLLVMPIREKYRIAPERVIALTRPGTAEWTVAEWKVDRVHKIVAADPTSPTIGEIIV